MKLKILTIFDFTSWVHIFSVTRRKRYVIDCFDISGYFSKCKKQVLHKSDKPRQIITTQAKNMSKKENIAIFGPNIAKKSQ